METVLNFIQNVIVPPMEKIGNEKHLKGIRNGLIATIPFIVVGSLFLIIANLPINGWSKIIGKFANYLSVPVNASFGVLGLLASISIGYSLAKEYNVDPIGGALMSLVAFLTTQVTSKYTLDTSNFGSTGLFTAILTAIISIEITKFFVKRNIVIKLPDSVPPAIANSFMTLVPAGVVILLIWFIRVILNFDITKFLQKVFSPIVFGLNTLPGVLVYMLVVVLLWTVGIHGTALLSAIGDPIFMQFVAENAKAFASHQPIPYITAYGFINNFVNLGGTGATIGLVLLMLRSKSKFYNSLGKIALPPGIFEINEPVSFGVPIVMNPVMMIPYVVTPLILTAVTYLLMLYNIIGRPVALLPWTTPPIIGQFLLTGGDWKAAVWGVIEIVICAAVYYPFFKAAEKEQLKIESGEEVSAEN